MKNKLKGMTLVELVVAIAILGLGSTMLVTSFATVSMVNRETHQFNERMCQQIKISENAEANDSRVSGVLGVVKMSLDKPTNEQPERPIINQPTCFSSLSSSVELAGNSYWVDIKADNDTMVAEDIDFKYYNVLIPPEKPSSAETEGGLSEGVTEE